MWVLLERLLKREWKERWNFGFLPCKIVLFSEKNYSFVISKFIWIDRFPVRLQRPLKTTPHINTALLDFKLRLLSVDLPLQKCKEHFFEKIHIGCLSVFADRVDVIYRDGWAIWLMRVPLSIHKSTSAQKMSFQEYGFYYPGLFLKAKLMLTDSTVGAGL